MKKESITLTNQQLQGIDATINWGYLYRGRGGRRVENILQVIIGRILFWVSFIVEVGIIASEIIQKNYFSRITDTSTITSLLFWIFFLIFLYSLYLLRDRSSFLDSSREQSLYDVWKRVQRGQKVEELELSAYLSHDVLWLFDYGLNYHEPDYLVKFWNKLTKIPQTLQLFRRFGIAPDQFDVGVLSIATQNSTHQEIFKNILLASFEFAFERKFKRVTEKVVAFVMMQRFFSEFLLRHNITEQDFEGIALWLENEAVVQKYMEDWKYRLSVKPTTTVNRSYTSRFTPTLNAYAYDYTMAVIGGNFQVSIARDNELNLLINLIEKGDRSAVLVLGEPGVGKSTLLKSLAVRMVVEEVPKKLQDMRLVGFDFNKAFSDSEDIDEFKRKLRLVFEEVSQSRNVVLVMDNIDQLLNLRSEFSGEIINVIVDAYDSNKVRLIATTNQSQFTKYIRPNKALSAIFSPVEMAVPSDAVTTQIVFDETSSIESEYGAKISYAAVKAAVELSHKFAYERVLPDKAIDLLKETVAKFKHLAGQKPIGYEEVAQTVTTKVGVQLGAISEEESQKLTQLEDRMHQRVIGQHEAIKAVSEALRRSRSGLAEGKRPIASFLFFGPTGVGKTEVAKTVAEVYYGNEERMVRIDMSEYNEEDNMKRLLGYTNANGGFEGGFLTEPIRDNPFSLLLLDEIDKANPKVLDLFLQVLDEGSLEDGLGRKIDFTNTIIIATSNAGSAEIAKLLEGEQSYDTVQEKALEELKRVFRIEFLNRFDKIIMFKTLTREEIKLVAQKFVEQVRKTLQGKGITLEYDEGLLERLAGMGYSPVFGAREMRRVVQEQVENRIADKIVSGEVRAGGRIKL